MQRVNGEYDPAGNYTDDDIEPEVRDFRPEIQGLLRKPYRLWTIEHIPFDRLPAYSNGGPARVALDPWSISTSQLCKLFTSSSVIEKARAAGTDNQVTLNAREIFLDGRPTRPHALDKTVYSSKRAADRAAYEAGLTAFLVYECDERKYNL